jgi:hypothetical protein
MADQSVNADLAANVRNHGDDLLSLRKETSGAVEVEDETFVSGAHAGPDVAQVCGRSLVDIAT